MNRIYYVRHGENPANVLRVFSSRHVDYPLTEKGVLQAQQTGEYLATQEIHAIFCSPMLRTLQTAQIIGERLGLPVTPMEEFREVQVGDMELEPATPEAWERHNNVFRAWFHGEHAAAFPNGDSYHSLTGRFLDGLRQITTGLDGMNLALVGHGGIFYASLARLFPELDLEWIRGSWNHNCAVTDFWLAEDNGRLVGKMGTWASCSHLSGAAADLVTGLPPSEDAE